MSKHTPTPWTITDGKRFPEWEEVPGNIIGADGEVVCAPACITNHPGKAHPRTWENCRRICAAMSACEGLSTDILEKIAASEQKALWTSEADIRGLLAWRDLLAASQTAVEWLDNPIGHRPITEVSNVLRNAIKKATRKDEDNGQPGA